MTQNEAIKLAIKANLIMFDYDHPSLGAFATLVAEKEREACAGLRKEVVLQGKHTVEYEEGFWDGLEKYEDLIKARGLT